MRLFCNRTSGLKISSKEASIENYINHMNCSQKKYMKKLDTLNALPSMHEKYQFIKQETLSQLHLRNRAFFDRHDVFDQFVGLGPVPLMMMGLSLLKLVKSAMQACMAVFSFSAKYDAKAISSLKDSASYALIALASFMTSFINVFTKTFATAKKGWAPSQGKRFDADYVSDEKDVMDGLLKI